MEIIFFTLIFIILNYCSLYMCIFMTTVIKTRLVGFRLKKIFIICCCVLFLVPILYIYIELYRCNLFLYQGSRDGYYMHNIYEVNNIDLGYNSVWFLSIRRIFCSSYIYVICMSLFKRIVNYLLFISVQFKRVCKVFLSVWLRIKKNNISYYAISLCIVLILWYLILVNNSVIYCSDSIELCIGSNIPTTLQDLNSIFISKNIGVSSSDNTIQDMLDYSHGIYPLKGGMQTKSTVDSKTMLDVYITPHEGLFPDDLDRSKLNIVMSIKEINSMERKVVVLETKLNNSYDINRKLIYLLCVVGIVLVGVLISSYSY